MAKGDDVAKKFAEMKAQQKEINHLSSQLEEGLGKQLKMQNDILKVKQNIAHMDAQRAKAEAKQAEDEKKKRETKKAKR